MTAPTAVATRLSQKFLAGGLHLVEVDPELGPGELDVLAALGDEVEDESDRAEVGEEGRRQVYQRVDEAETGNVEEREKDELLLQEDGENGQRGVEREEERGVADEEALVGRGDDRPAFVEVSFRDLAGRAEGGDGLFDGGVGEFARSLGGLLHDMAADLGQDLLPFGPAGEEVADLFEVGFELVRHGISPWRSHRGRGSGSSRLREGRRAGSRPAAVMA